MHPAESNPPTSGSELETLPEPRKKKMLYQQNWWLHAVLFTSTAASTYMVGSWMSGDAISFGFQSSGFLYAASIMSILVVHEMGHFITARIHRVDASLPYFIPAPFPPIGTFGAFIRMNKPPRTLASMADIGYGGPLAGVVVAIVLCYIGLELSEVKPALSMPDNSWTEGNSILYWALKKLAHPEMRPDEDVWLHPMAWAGWLGLLVTNLNLLPAGQLDGGHIVYALLGPKKHEKIGKWVHILVLLLGICGVICHIALAYEPTSDFLNKTNLRAIAQRGTGMVFWLVWALLLKLIGGRHPQIQDLTTPLRPARIALGLLAMLIFVLTFTPVFLSGGSS